MSSKPEAAHLACALGVRDVALFMVTAGCSLYWSGGHGAAGKASPGYFIGFSVVALGIAVALNLRGLKVAKWLNNGGAVARWLLTILLVVLAFSIWRRFGSAAPMIVTVYLVGTASLLIAAPPERTTALYGLMEAIRSAALRLDISWLIPVAVVTMILEIVGSVGVWLGAVARIPFVAGIDRYLPRSFAKLHPRYGVPTTAICSQALIIALLAIMGQAGTSVRGAYSVLVEMMVIATMLPFVPLFASAIKLSAGAPVPGEARIPGGRLTVVTLALIGLATTVGAMVLAFVPPADEVNPALAACKIAGMTTVLLLAGAIVYFVGRARARRLDHHS